MLRSPVIISIIVITTAFAVFITITFGAYKGLNSLVGGGQISGSDSRIVGGHVPGYPVATTSGSILDPAQMDVDANLSNYVDDPMKYLREFNYGRVSELSDGRILREFTLIASDNLVKEISPGVFYNVWTFNGTVPGPTIRATEGDLIRIKFMNNGSMAHSLHLHGIHPANMDGVFDMVSPGGTFTYEFTAEPFGVFPYHCHMTPLEEHIAHGLYGVFIVDPRTPRPPADEMVMVMNGYDTDFDAENNFYTVNGIPYYYMHHPIKIEKDRLVRIYLVNMLEYDPLNNFHLHANMFNYYPSGTRLQPDELTDIVTTNQGERGILEFTYKYPGKYMFHAHKTEFAEKGWMGTFLVTERGGIQNSNQTDTNPYYDVLNNSFVRSGIEGDQM
jgi:FtsP/CotA-like multicopper oxidase with cupredoxin domain